MKPQTLPVFLRQRPESDVEDQPHNRTPRNPKLWHGVTADSHLQVLGLSFHDAMRQITGQ